MRYARTQIDAIGYALPPQVVSTRELEDRLAEAYRSLHISTGEVEHISGIRERRFWPAGYTVTQGATAAAVDALAKAQVASHELGALLYGGVCREHFEPATACHVAGALKESGLKLSDDQRRRSGESSSAVGSWAISPALSPPTRFFAGIAHWSPRSTTARRSVAPVERPAPSPTSSRSSSRWRTRIRAGVTPASAVR